MITITGTTNGVKVDFNGYYDSGAVKTKMGYWAKGSVRRVLNYGDYIEVNGLSDSWILNVDGNNKLLGVDAVDGIAPADIDHLYQLLTGVLS